VRLVASAPTAALRQAVFGGDDDLDEGGLRAARALTAARTGRHPLGCADEWLSGPARAALQTASAGGRQPTVVAALADCGYGRWSGRTLGDVAAAEPEAVHAWLRDPDAAPHGGESITALTARVAAWLGSRAAHGARAVAFTHPAVVRAALVHALGLPPTAFFQLDVAPLSVTRLRWRSGRWTLYLPPIG
jgi:broad specificity phosphatase PhoE